MFLFHSPLQNLLCGNLTFASIKYCGMFLFQSPLRNLWCGNFTFVSILCRNTIILNVFKCRLERRPLALRSYCWCTRECSYSCLFGTSLWSPTPNSRVSWGGIRNRLRLLTREKGGDSLVNRYLPVFGNTFHISLTRFWWDRWMREEWRNLPSK